MPASIERRRLLMAAASTPFVALHASAGEASPGQLIVSYIEGAGTAGGLVKSLRAYSAGVRKRSAFPELEILRELGRANRMVVLERRAADLSPDDQSGLALQGAAEGLVQAPIDRRAFAPLTPLLGKAHTKAFHMVMHVDVVPDNAAVGGKLLIDERALVLAAPGAIGFEAGTQSDRVNHFAVHEVWASRAAYEAYASSPAGRDLRTRIAAIRGAPFDDRFFVSVSDAVSK